MKLLIKERQKDGSQITAEFSLELTGGNIFADSFRTGPSAAEREKLTDFLLRLENAGNADGTMRVWIQED